MTRFPTFEEFIVFNALMLWTTGNNRLELRTILLFVQDDILNLQRTFHVLSPLVLLITPWDNLLLLFYESRSGAFGHWVVSRPCGRSPGVCLPTRFSYHGIPPFWSQFSLAEMDTASTTLWLMCGWSSWLRPLTFLRAWSRPWLGIMVWETSLGEYAGNTARFRS